MTFIKANYQDLKENDYSPLPEGEYEVIIEQAAHNVSQSGAESVQMKLKVRKDLDNVPELAETNKKYHNRVVWINNWKRHSTGQYNDQQFQYILNALKVPENKEFNTLDDYCQFIEKNPIRAFIKVTTDEYNGKSTKRNDVAPWGFTETKFPMVNQTAPDPFKDSKEKVEISDADIPF